MGECRYILRKDNAIVDIEDTLHTRTLWVGIDGVRAIGLTRSDLEELKKKIDKVLAKP